METRRQIAEFKAKVQSLDIKSLETLFEQLKAEEAPLGMIMYVGQVYADKQRSPLARLRG